MSRSVIVIGGPNGAGKTTFARALVLGRLPASFSFLNADMIAEGMSPFRPQLVAVEAGKEFLRRFDKLVDHGRSFVVESTLSGESLAGRLERLKALGYAVEICYLWLPNAQFAIDRVRTRVRRGGHAIPDDVVARRFARSYPRFVTRYRILADSWIVLDGSATPPVAVARGMGEEVEAILDTERYRAVCGASGGLGIEEELGGYGGATTGPYYLDDLESVLKRVEDSLREWESLPAGEFG